MLSNWWLIDDWTIINYQEVVTHRQKCGTLVDNRLSNKTIVQNPSIIGLINIIQLYRPGIILNDSYQQYCILISDINGPGQRFIVYVYQWLIGIIPMTNRFLKARNYEIYLILNYVKSLIAIHQYFLQQIWGIFGCLQILIEIYNSRLSAYSDLADYHWMGIWLLTSPTTD